MATHDSRALRRPTRTDRRASGGRSGNRRRKNPARKRVVRRHFPYHVPNERGGTAAREDAARYRAARDRRCADGAQFPRVFTATACVTDCRSPCRSKLCGFTNLNNPRENIMTNQTNPYEPLTSENAPLVLVDHQVGLMTGVRDYSTGELKHNVVALAKAAKDLKLPIVVMTTARDSMWGPTIPELVEALPGVEIIDRSSVNAFDDARVARAIEATKRKKLIFAGISLEVCAAFPAITAVGKGLDAYVAVDASGTFSETKRQAGLLRMLQAGVIISDYTTLMVEVLKDNGRPEAAEVYGAMDMGWAKLVGQIAQAYGK